jgi:hypothetical protein
MIIVVKIYQKFSAGPERSGNVIQNLFIINRILLIRLCRDPNYETRCEVRPVTTVAIFRV